MNWNPYYRQEARREGYRAEEQEKERVLGLINHRRMVHRDKVVMGEVEHQLVVDAFNELENAVRQGFWR